MDLKANQCVSSEHTIQKVSVEMNHDMIISSFSNMKLLGVFQLPPRWDASLSPGYFRAFNLLVSIYTLWRRRVKYLAQIEEHNTMSPAWIQHGPLDPEASTQTMTPVHHNYNVPER